jgi:cell wall-associated NlpC family hydrolase
MLLRRPALSGISGLLLAIALILSSFPTTAATATYKIKQGDTLSAIAHRHHTTVAKLMKANHLRETSILALGKGICLPGQKAKAHAHSARPKHVAKAAHQTASAVHVNAGSASLRSAPSSGAHRVALLSTGATMKVLARQGKWAKVALSSGTCGFVYRPLLAPGSGSAKPAAVAVAKSTTPSEPDRSDNSVIRIAMACRGTHYVRGGTSRGGFDCSGFTRYVYAKYGISLPHSSAAQAGRGTAVSRGELKAGDLVFFQTYRRGISHVGIYIGNGNFVHAASRGRGVTVDALESCYYAPRYRGARRIE